MRDAAARLSALLPPDRFDPAVLAWVAESSPRGTWAVGFSGGADSLALLLLVWSHWPDRRGRLRALHFDHRMRGAESREDVQFCRKVCSALAVKFEAGTWPGTHVGASEAEAREARLEFFSRRSRVLWLGHQQDDIAETMLMRLARGSGAGGLAAPRPVQVFATGRVHLRPLLGLKKAEILAALQAAGVEWREDSTNAAPDYFRNRVRAGVLPGWVTAARRDAVAGAARSRLLLEEDDAALETWLDEISPVDRWGRLRLEKLRGRPLALWRRALHRWLAANPRTGTPKRQAVDALLAAVAAGNRVRQSLGKHGFAVGDGRLLKFEFAPAKTGKFRRRAN